MAEPIAKSSVVKQQTAEGSVQQPTPESNSTLKTLVSRLAHSVTLDYGDDNIVIPPRGTVPNVDPTKLDGTLPKSVVLVANTGKK